MERSNMVIGIVGGMGPHATVDLFRRLVEAFPTEKDWEKPRIIVDNYSTIPSRVRAVLYNERREEIIECLAMSIRHMMDIGVQKIIVGCHTAHIFLPEAIKRVKGSEKCVLNIIQSSRDLCMEKGYDKMYLLASEGTVQTGIYKDVFCNSSIDILNPTEEELVRIRELIEEVKQGKVTERSIERFADLVNGSECPVLLGCSELPVLYGEAQKLGEKFNNIIVDPFQCVIEMIKR